ncbi:MAG: hypothetical protein OXC81_00210 [Betaproteobacteria bacterium]|nr:hypothetical protein [Betaproteobacteria bacterium]
MLQGIIDAAAAAADILRHASYLFFGSRLRAALSAAALGLAAGYIAGHEPGSGDQAQVQNELAASVTAAKYFEKKARQLQLDLEGERSRRRIAEHTATALASDIRTRDREFLETKQQLAFYEQLLAERGQGSDEVSVRNFTIDPDIHEASYRANVVLARSGNIKEPFVGRLQFNLVITDAQAAERDYSPAAEEEDVTVQFRYYLEKQVPFRIPIGHEIVNAQLLVLDSENRTIVAVPLFTPE